MANNQEAFHEAISDLFSHLDRVEEHLQNQEKNGPFYFGDSITEADVRLYVTIIRFDPVYVNLFKTNRKMIRYDYPAIHKWVRHLYWNVPAFHDTTEFEHIKGHYFKSLIMLNPNGVVPEGPLPNIFPVEH